MEENTITIPVEEFKELIKAKVAVEILEREVNSTRFSIERAKIARICDFELKKDEESEG